MNYKNLLLILFFLTSCTVQSTQYSENIFSNRGFVLLYDESLIEKKLLRKPLDDRSLEIVHNTLSKGTKVRIINLLNNKSTNAIVKTKNKNLISTQTAARRIIKGLIEERFLIFTDNKTNKLFKKKSKNYESWIIEIIIYTNPYIYLNSVSFLCLLLFYLLFLYLI